MSAEPGPSLREDAGDDDFLGRSYPIAPVPDGEREPRSILIEIPLFVAGFPERAHSFGEFTNRINAELLKHDATAVV